MILSHEISDAVLACTGIGVFLHYCGHLAYYSRLLWGFFLLTITMSALVGLIAFAGYTPVEPLHYSLEVLVNSLGMVCVVRSVWALIMHRKVGVMSFAITLILGLVFFIVLLLPDVRVFIPVFQALGILVMMLLAVYGLLQREMWAAWIVVAAMLLGLATKASAFGQYIHPVDFYHYVVALALLSFGKAIEQSKTRKL